MDQLNQLLQRVQLFNADDVAARLRANNNLHPADRVAQYVVECIQGTNSNMFFTVDIRISGGAPNVNHEMGTILTDNHFLSFSSRSNTGTSWIKHISSPLPTGVLSLQTLLGNLANNHQCRITFSVFRSEWLDTENHDHISTSEVYYIII